MSTTTRYAPSPTGGPHFGNMRTALFNDIYSAATGGEFIIRVEDTDTARNVDGALEAQLQTMSALGMKWSNDPQDKSFHQSNRLELYKKYAVQLVDAGLAYFDEAGIRFKTPDVIIEFNDIILGKQTQSLKHVLSQDMVIIRANGVATYQFAVVVDDHEMGVSHVLRGSDHLTNTPKQLAIYAALGWEPPQFGHMPLITKNGGKKMSKRDDDQSTFITSYLQQGYLPEAIYNYIALLGWSPKDNEVLTRDEIIAQFKIEDMLKAPAQFDGAKLKWLSQQHMKRLSNAELHHRLAMTGFNPALVYEAIDIVREKAATLEELRELVLPILQDKVHYNAEAYHALYEEETSAIVVQELSRLVGEGFKPSLVIKEISALTGIKGKALFSPIRAAVTGQVHGSDLNRILEALGKERILNRVNAV